MKAVSRLDWLKQPQESQWIMSFFFLSRYVLITYLKAELQYSAISKTEMNSESFVMYLKKLKKRLSRK